MLVYNSWRRSLETDDHVGQCFVRTLLVMRRVAAWVSEAVLHGFLHDDCTRAGGPLNARTQEAWAAGMHRLADAIRGLERGLRPEVAGSVSRQSLRKIRRYYFECLQLRQELKRRSRRRLRGKQARPLAFDPEH